MASINEYGTGYGNLGTGTPVNYDGTGFLHIEVPPNVITDVAYTDDGVYYYLGGLATVIPYRPVSATGPITVDDGVIAGTSGSGADITVTLPTAASAGAGKMLTVKKVDSGSKKVIVAANGSEKIDGAASADLVSQYDSITLISTGTAWMTTAKVVITP
jgi:hypothetical protein